jgi:hypothetical protein
MIRPLCRRTLLRGAGAALALPLLDAMVPARAVADTPTPPKRAVFVFSGNGFPMKQWKPTVDAADATKFTLSPILAPLAPHASDCLFLSGLPMNSSYDPGQHATAHPGGCASVLTGSYAGPGTMYDGDDSDGNGAGYAVSESVDHTLATALGGATKFPAYHLGVIKTVPEVITRPFMAAGQVPITPVHDPWVAFQELFGDLGKSKSELDKQIAERKVVLDAVIDEARALRCRLGGADRIRLEQHLAALEEIEKKLALTGGGAACAAPVLGDPIATQDFKNIPALGKLQMDQLAMALACDLTRVAGLQWISPVNGVVYSWLGHTEEHHSISHKTDPASVQKLVDIGRWYAEQLAYLIEALKGIPEGGGTVFDSTVIVWVSECGDPWTHDRKNVGFTLAGSAGGAFVTGRAIEFPAGAAHSHNRLLLTLLASMGVPAPAFGPPEYCVGGPLDALLA